MDDWIGVAFALCCGILFIAVGVPLMTRRVAPNSIHGYRTFTTKNNPDIWYEVNVLTGKHLASIGAILVMMGVVGLAALNDPRQQEMLLWTSLAVIGIGLAYAIYSGYARNRDLRGES